MATLRSVNRRAEVPGRLGRASPLGGCSRHHATKFLADWVERHLWGDAPVTTPLPEIPVSIPTKPPGCRSKPRTSRETGCGGRNLIVIGAAHGHHACQRQGPAGEKRARTLRLRLFKFARNTSTRGIDVASTILGPNCTLTGPVCLVRIHFGTLRYHSICTPGTDRVRAPRGY